MTRHGITRERAVFSGTVGLILHALLLGSAWAQCTVTESAKLTALKAKAYDYSGYSVAADGNVLLVGAGGVDHVASSDGAADVYRFDGSAWIEEQRLTASDGASWDFFGNNVALDGPVALIGADGNNNSSGTAYIFRHDGLTWFEEQKLVAGDPKPHASFGFSTAVDGDVAVIGASRDSNGGSKTGSVYVYRYVESTWIEEQKLVAADSQADASFGDSVAVCGDVVVVGARHHRHGTRGGAVYIFRKNGSNWVEEQKLAPEDAIHFASSVAASKDVVVVGAVGVYDGAELAGAAYVFRHDGASWVREQRLVASDATTGQMLGYSVATSDDVVVVGAPGTEVNKGAAYMFQHDGTTWVEQQKLVASDGFDLDFLGVTVSCTGDRTFVGAHFDDDGGDNAGAAYVFDWLKATPCLSGTVNLAVEPTATDLLKANGESGCMGRRIDVPAGAPIVISMDAPPAGPSPAPFVLYAWPAEPDASTESPQPARLGTMCFPTFLSVGVPKPDTIWNNAGHEPLLGTPDFASQPAPSIVVSRSNGRHLSTTVTLQGFIVDHGSAAAIRASVTNAIVLRIIE